MEIDYDKRIHKLVSKSEYIIREANFQFKNLGILWSGGKDSTVIIDLARKALGERFFKMPILFLNTGFQFQDTIEYMWELSKKWEFNYIDVVEDTHFVPNESYVKFAKKGVKVADRFECCNARKTQALRSALKKYKADAVLVGIRRDEQAIRNKERFFSPRDTDGKWDYWNQPIEMQGWDLFVEENPSEKHHMRVHPLLEWTEEDVWFYMKKYEVPVNNIYYSVNGKRYRSIGCAPCTTPLDSKASTIDEIIKEVIESKETEREGREQDKEADMMRMRALGYM